MSLRSSKIIILIALFLSFLFPVLSLATSKSEIMQQVRTAGDEAEITTEKLPQQYIAEIIGILLGTVGIIFMILIVYGGYNLITARGNEEKEEKALKIIRPAIVGLVIILTAYGITYFVASNFQQVVSSLP